MDRLLAHGGEMEASAPAQTPAKTSTAEESQQSDNVPAVNASGSVDNAEAKSLKCDEWVFCFSFQSKQHCCQGFIIFKVHTVGFGTVCTWWNLYLEFTCFRGCRLSNLKQNYGVSKNVGLALYISIAALELK